MWNLNNLCIKWFFAHLLGLCLMAIFNYVFPEYARILVTALLNMEPNKIIGEPVVYRMLMWLMANLVFLLLALDGILSKNQEVDIDKTLETTWKLIPGLILITLSWLAVPFVFHCANCSIGDDIFYFMLLITIAPGIQVISYILAIKVRFKLIGR